jgi:CHAD domain-containing protein
MKDPLQIRLRSMQTPAQAERHVIRVRFAECLQREPALEGDDDERVHGFRLACKRLRFALERLESPPEELERAAWLLSRVCDELGWAHDCARLAQVASECGAPAVGARALRDRARYLVRARRVWRHAFKTNGEFAPLAAYAGFSWSIA